MAWFNPSDPNSGTHIVSEEAIANRRKVAEAMARRAAKARAMTSPWQAVAQGFEGFAAGMEARKVDQMERSSNNTLADKMAAAFGAGSSATPEAAAVATSAADTGPAGSAAIAGAGPLNVSPEIKEGLAQTAAALKVDPVDLATLVSYETGGTFDPTKRGPTTKWGQHRGLIQFGEPQAKEHGVDWANPVGSQLGPNGAIFKYFQKNGAQPGMGLLDLYSIVNAGGPGRYNASDAAAGGAPGTVRDKVEKQMHGHRAKAQALFTANADLPAPGASTVDMETGADGFVIPGVENHPTPTVVDPLQNPVDNGASLPPQDAIQPLAQAGGVPPSIGSAPAGTQPWEMVQGGAGPSAQPVEQPETNMPLPPVFQSEGISQPWMNTALPADRATQALLSTQQPPARPANLAMPTPQADLPAPGAVPAVGQLPSALPQTAPRTPDLTNTESGGAREFAVAEGQRRLGLPSGDAVTSVTQALQARGIQPRGLAPPPESVAKVVAALPRDAGTGEAVPAQPATAALANAQALGSNMPAQAKLGIDMIRAGRRTEGLAIVMEAMKPKQYGFQVVGDQMYRTDPRTGQVSPVGVEKPVQPMAVAAGTNLVDPRSGKVVYQGGQGFKSLTDPAERAAAGIPADDRRPYQVGPDGKLSSAGGGTTVNVDTKGPSKFTEKANELQAKRYGEMAEASDSARQMQGDLDMLEGMSKGIATGRGAETRLAMAQFAKAWGWDDIASGLTGGKLPEMEAFTALIDKLTPQMRQGMPGAASDRDVTIFRNALPSMLRTPEGNQIVLGTLRSMNDYKMRQGDIATQALRGEISQAEADNAVRALESPFAKFKEYRAAQDNPAGGAAAGTQAAPQQPAQSEPRKSVGGKSYVKRGNEWFQE